MATLRLSRILPTLLVCAVSAQAARADQFLSFPLASSIYPWGAHTAGKIITVLDHSMVDNGSGVYQYGSQGGKKDGKIIRFTGEAATGAAQDGLAGIWLLVAKLMLSLATAFESVTEAGKYFMFAYARDICGMLKCIL
jgi:hypothetical protein